jgi:hypothetical protein
MRSLSSKLVGKLVGEARQETPPIDTAWTRLDATLVAMREGAIPPALLATALPMACLPDRWRVT